MDMSRYTNDVDLIIAFERENLAKALAILKAMKYQPRAPVPIEQFADAEKRKEWQESKGLKAFALISSEHKETEVDLFIDDPLGFEDAIERAMLYPLSEDLEMPVCGLADLLKLKRQANRGKDLVDLEKLSATFFRMFNGYSAHKRSPNRTTAPADPKGLEPRGGKVMNWIQLRRTAAWPLPEKIKWLVEGEKIAM